MIRAGASAGFMRWCIATAMLRGPVHAQRQPYHQWSWEHSRNIIIPIGKEKINIFFMWLKSKPVCLSQRPNPFASNKITGNLRLTYSIVLGNIVLTPCNWPSAHSASAHPTGLAAQAFKLQYQPPHNHHYDLLNMIHSNEQTHGAVYQGDWHFIFLGTKKTWCWAQICGSYLHCREVIFPSAEKLGDVQLMTPPCREWLYIHPEPSPP